MTSTYLTQRGRSLRSIRRAAFTLGLSIFAATGAGYSASARAQTGASEITIETRSTRPNFVTGGEVLVKISYPGSSALGDAQRPGHNWEIPLEHRAQHMACPCRHPSAWTQCIARSRKESLGDQRPKPAAHQLPDQWPRAVGTSFATVRVHD